MRIISDFKDYYDCMQIGESDFSYIRKEFTTYEKLPYWYVNPSPGIYCDNILVGFCGRLYNYCRFFDRHDHKEYTYCFTFDEINAYVKSKLSKSEYESFCTPRNKIYNLLRPTRRHHRHFVNYGFLSHLIKERIEKFSRSQDSFRDLFIKNKSPIFSVNFIDYKDDKGSKKFRVDWNCDLSSLGFQKVLDPPQAYQELNMWFNNLSSVPEVIPEISDTDMVTIKGFDKWSFRKPPRK